MKLDDKQEKEQEQFTLTKKDDIVLTDAGLRYFTVKEFRGQLDLIDPKLLEVIDEFRHLWGTTVYVSNSPAAIGRTYGVGFHNYVKHGSVKAIDLIPAGMKTTADFARAKDLALQAGARGVGLYPKWNQGPGIHIDVGQRTHGGIGLWSAYPTGPGGKQEYVGIDVALNDPEFKA
jgi:uncharacterized protein YcbK (DUF882 family)